jgi:ceramide glucosyltransferase
MSFEVVVVVVAAAALAGILASDQAMRRALRPSGDRAPRLATYPSITVIRPIRGLDVGAEANVAAALDNGYPGAIETLFVFDDESDPAWPLVEQAVARHRADGRPGDAALLVAGPPPPGRTGKLNAMMVGARLARGELVAFCDSDARPDRDVLRILVETLAATPGAGDTFAPALVGSPARTAGDVGYALLLNSWYGASVALAAGADRSLPFIMGQMMVFKRATLDAIGGVGCAHGQLVDDMYIGRVVARAGYRNVMVHHPLYIANEEMSFSQFMRVLRRWLLFSRNGLPLRFTEISWFRGAAHWLAALAFVAALDGGLALTLVPAAALAASVVSQLSLQRAFGGPPVPARYAWVPLALPIISLPVALTALLHKRVAWRGRAYPLGAQARLAS